MPKSKKDKREQKSDKHSDKKEHKVLKTPQYQRLVDSYKHDFVELSSYHEYKEAEWAYFYAYPEYFNPAGLPGSIGKNEMLFNEDLFLPLGTGATGSMLLHFCPGVTGITRAAIPGHAAVPGANGIPGLPEVLPIPERFEPQVWLAGSPNPGEAFLVENSRSGWVGSDIAVQPRCIGAYLKVEAPPTTSGLFKHRQFVRNRTLAPHDLTSDLSGADSHPLSRTTIFRFRAPSYGSLLSGGAGTKEYYAHEILIYNLPANSTVSVTIKRIFQARLKAPLAALTYLETRTEHDFKLAKKVASQLIEAMPKELEFHPLYDAMEFHDHLFTNKGVKKSLFPEKQEIANMLAPVNLPNISHIDLNISSHRTRINGEQYSHRRHSQRDALEHLENPRHSHHHHGYRENYETNMRHGHLSSRRHDRKIQEALIDEDGNLKEISDGEIDAVPHALRDHLIHRYKRNYRHG